MQNEIDVIKVKSVSYHRVIELKVESAFAHTNHNRIMSQTFVGLSQLQIIATMHESSVERRWFRKDKNKRNAGSRKRRHKWACAHSSTQDIIYFNSLMKVIDLAKAVHTIHHNHEKQAFHISPKRMNSLKSNAY